MTGSRGSVTLGELVGRIDRLEIRCERCERHGRVRLARLTAEHGAETSLVELATRLEAGCANAKAADLSRRCFVHYPQLVELARRAKPGGEPAA